jgi:hypothetical protein
MFSAMDSDKSGDVTLQEVMVAVFPIASRQQIKVRCVCTPAGCCWCVSASERRH